MTARKGGEHVDVVHGAGQGRREVEAEAVDAHLGDPVAQRVGDEPEHVRLDDMQGVAAAGVVRVPAGVALEAVVAAVVDALQRQHRAQLTRFGGVVVDDVEDDLDPGLVQRPHHPLELADLLARRTGRRVARVRGEVADRVVAPVVLQAPAQQMVLVRELVDGQQLHGRHAQLHQVLDRRRVRQPGVGAPEFLRYAGVQFGEAADVDLVDDRVRPRCLRAAVVHPLVVGGVVVHDDTLRDVGRGVAVVAHGVRDLLLRPVTDMRVDLGRQPELAVHRPRVRVEEQLRRVPAGAGPRVPAAVHPEAVALSRHDARQEAVPDLVRQLGQRGARLHALRVEQTQLDRLRTPAHSAKLVPATPSGPTRYRAPNGIRAPATRAGAALCAGRRSARVRRVAPVWPPRRAPWARRRRRAPPARPPARLRSTPSGLPRLMERRGEGQLASRPRVPVMSFSPLFCPELGPHSRFPERARSLGTP